MSDSRRKLPRQTRTNRSAGVSIDHVKSARDACRPFEVGAAPRFVALVRVVADHGPGRDPEIPDQMGCR